MNWNERGGMEWKIEKCGWGGGNRLGWMEGLKKGEWNKMRGINLVKERLTEKSGD